MDPLSNVLSILKPRNCLSAGLEAGGAWSIRFPGQKEGIKCGAVVSGECWLDVEGIADPIRLTDGDCFLLPSGRPFRLASDRSLPSAEAGPIFAAKGERAIACINGGEDFYMVSSRFVIDGHPAEILLRMLSPIVLVRDESGQAALRWLLEQMLRELRAPEPGGSLIVEHLAQMILVRALRLHLAEGAKGGVGWMFALADRQMSLALGAMHGDPARRWTLQSLAECAGLSRSTFAERFRQTVGEPPLEYLTRWRMLLAADRLAKSGEPVSTIALSLGYESDSAFSTAFKRVMGCPPRRYARDPGPASANAAATQAARAAGPDRRAG